MNYILNITSTVAKLSTPHELFPRTRIKSLLQTIQKSNYHYSHISLLTTTLYNVNKQMATFVVQGVNIEPIESVTLPRLPEIGKINTANERMARDRKSMETMDSENTSAIRHMFDRVQFRNSRGTVIR